MARLPAPGLTAGRIKDDDEDDVDEGEDDVDEGEDDVDEDEDEHDDYDYNLCV